MPLLTNYGNSILAEFLKVEVLDLVSALDEPLIFHSAPQNQSQLMGTISSAGTCRCWYGCLINMETREILLSDVTTFCFF